MSLAEIIYVGKLLGSGIATEIASLFDILKMVCSSKNLIIKRIYEESVAKYLFLYKANCWVRVSNPRHNFHHF